MRDCLEKRKYYGEGLVTWSVFSLVHVVYLHTSSSSDMYFNPRNFSIEKFLFNLWMPTSLIAPITPFHLNIAPCQHLTRVIFLWSAMSSEIRWTGSSRSVNQLANNYWDVLTWSVDCFDPPYLLINYISKVKNNLPLSAPTQLNTMQDVPLQCQVFSMRGEAMEHGTREDSAEWSFYGVALLTWSVLFHITIVDPHPFNSGDALF